MVGSDISRARGDLNGLREQDLLPAASSFAGESGSGQQLPASGPQTACMNARVGRALVVADALDISVRAGDEFAQRRLRHGRKTDDGDGVGVLSGKRRP